MASEIKQNIQQDIKIVSEEQNIMLSMFEIVDK
jgi:hypothetical protein